MDTTTPHNGTSLEVRLGYLFRLHDANSDQRLNMAELINMSNDMINLNHQGEQVANMLSAYFANAISRNPVPSLDLEQFVQVVVSNKTVCQLTELLFRSSENMLLVIAIKFDFYGSSYCANNSTLSSIVLNDKYSKACQVCRSTKFHILNSVIRLSLNGEVAGFQSLETKPNLKISPVTEIKVCPLNTVALDVANKVTQVGIKMLNEQTSNSIDENIKHWYFSNQSQHAEMVKQILLGSKTKLQHESKIVSVNSPCYVISGLFGNFKDLLTISHQLFKSTPSINQATYVFLGNLVGPQSYNLECLIYALCMKILAPQRFIILRGIYETRENQIKGNTFRNECKERFGSDEMWNLANEVFDHFPIGAIIEDKIFCSTSAFPKVNQSLQSINATPLDHKVVRDIL